MANAKEVSPQHALPFEEDVHTRFSNPALDEVVRSTPGSEAVVSDAVKTDGAASGNDGPDTASLQQAVTVGSPSPEHGVDGRAHAEQDQPHTTETVAAAAHERLGLSKWQHRYMVVVFALMAALLNADQNLLQPHLTQVAEDFGISEDDKDTMLGGYIPAAFFCVGAPSALLLGWCADKYNRQYMLFAVVIIGQGPTLATYWVDKYWQLFLLRVITGVAVGGVFPLLYSMLGDMYPASQRVGVAAFVSIATGAGVAAGQGLSGFAGNGNWRIPFLIIAAPSIALAFVMLMTTHEPARGACEEALQGVEDVVYKETITWAKVKLLFKIPSNWLIFLQGLPGSLPWGMILTFMNDYLSNNRGMSVQLATLVVTIFGLGGGLGVIGGSMLGQWLYNKGWKEAVAILSGVTILLAIGPMYYLVNAPVGNINIAPTLIMAFLGGTLASVAGPNLRAVLLNVNTPETRGVAFAMQTLTDDLGKGLGPIIVAGFSRELGRRNAFNVATVGWVPCAVLLASLMFFMRKDEATVQERVTAAQRSHQQVYDNVLATNLLIPVDQSHPNIDGERGGTLGNNNVDNENVEAARLVPASVEMHSLTSNSVVTGLQSTPRESGIASSNNSVRLTPRLVGDQTSVPKVVA